MVELPYCPHCMLNKTFSMWIHLCLDIRYGLGPSADTLHGSQFLTLHNDQPSAWLVDAFLAVTHVHQILCLSSKELREGSCRRTGTSSCRATESGYVLALPLILSVASCGAACLTDHRCLMHPEEAQQGGC